MTVRFFELSWMRKKMYAQGHVQITPIAKQECSQGNKRKDPRKKNKKHLYTVY